MIRILIGIFMVLHGLVHLLYAGHSAKLFEMKPGMLWPDGAWAFSKMLGNAGTRNLATVLLIVAAAVFVAGGLGIFVRGDWWRPVVMGAAAFSSIVYILLWNGRMQNLDGQGAIGILINIAILLAVQFVRWPQLGL